MPLPPIVLGALLSSALSGIFNIGGTIAANQYNSPAAQLRRLRKAGLPMSYMYQGRVNTQSDVPKLSIDPTLGVAQQEQLDNQKKLVDAQVPKIKAEKEKLDIANDIQAGIRDWLRMQGKKRAGHLGPSGSNQEINLEIEQAEKLASSFIKQHEQRLKQLDRIVANTLFSEGVTLDQKRQGLAKVKQEIINMVKQAGLMSQLTEIREFEAFLNSTLTESVTSLPAWAQALTAIILKAVTLKR